MAARTGDVALGKGSTAKFDGASMCGIAVRGGDERCQRLVGPYRNEASFGAAARSLKGLR
jgi:hypothetical protein